MHLPFDVVWWRRPRAPFIPADVHPEDRDYIQKENTAFHESLPLMLVRDAWWVNPWQSVRPSNSKAYQLKLAMSCDLKIPPTLISNNPDDIKNFIKKHEETSVIFKPFLPHNWSDEKGLKMLYTQSVNAEQLPSNPVLQLAPGIYQARLEKLYELRVTCFGDYLVAVKIDSQKHPEGQTDWRAIRTGKLGLESYELSEKLKKRIQDFMKKMGIVFGCLDFIVSPDGEIHFLEVNQQGQFLWIEEFLPDIPMLDIFVQFLLKKTTDFSWINHSNPLRFKDYRLRAEQIIEHNMQNHIYLNGIKKKEKNL